jgi:hypothetical protein
MLFSKRNAALEYPNTPQRHIVKNAEQGHQFQLQDYFHFGYLERL